MEGAKLNGANMMGAIRWRWNEIGAGAGAGAGARAVKFDKRLITLLLWINLFPYLRFPFLLFVCVALGVNLDQQPPYMLIVCNNDYRCWVFSNDLQPDPPAHMKENWKWNDKGVILIIIHSGNEIKDLSLFFSFRD